MKTKKKIKVSSSVSVTIPTGWNELRDSQLRYIYQYLAMMPHERAKIYSFLYLSGAQNVTPLLTMQMWMMAFNGRVTLVSPDDLASAVSSVDWMDDLPERPVRLDWLCHSGNTNAHAVNQELHGVSFQDYITVENCFQGFLATKDTKYLQRMAATLYISPKEPKEIREIDTADILNLLRWVSSIKKLFSNVFPDFFRPIAEDETEAINMMEVMNAEIRALTGGDVTKEEAILKIDCWRALTELNEKAREAHELKK